MPRSAVLAALLGGCSAVAGGRHQPQTPGLLCTLGVPAECSGQLAEALQQFKFVRSVKREEEAESKCTWVTADYEILHPMETDGKYKEGNTFNAAGHLALGAPLGHFPEMVRLWWENHDAYGSCSRVRSNTKSQRAFMEQFLRARSAERGHVRPSTKFSHTSPSKGVVDHSAFHKFARPPPAADAPETTKHRPKCAGPRHKSMLRIPLVMWQTWEDPQEFGRLRSRRELQFNSAGINPELEYRMVYGHERDAFMLAYEDEDVVKAWKAISPRQEMIREKFWAMAVLYARGGIYLTTEESLGAKAAGPSRLYEQRSQRCIVSRLPVLPPLPPPLDPRRRVHTQEPPMGWPNPVRRPGKKSLGTPKAGDVIQWLVTAQMWYGQTCARSLVESARLPDGFQKKTASKYKRLSNDVNIQTMNQWTTFYENEVPKRVKQECNFTLWQKTMEAMTPPPTPAPTDRPGVQARDDRVMIWEKGHPYLKKVLKATAEEILARTEVPCTDKPNLRREPYYLSNCAWERSRQLVGSYAYGRHLANVAREKDHDGAAMLGDCRIVPIERWVGRPNGAHQATMERELVRYRRRDHPTEAEHTESLSKEWPPLYQGRKHR